MSIVFLTFFCSCTIFTPRYFCEIDEVDSIQIVMIDGVTEGEYTYEYTVLVQIYDLEQFINHLNEINCSTNWGDPHPIKVQNVAIRIEYNNKEYDLIQPNGQSFKRLDKYNSGGYYRFDDEQFEDLILKYMTLPETTG